MGCSTSESSTHGSALRLHEACQILQDSTTAKDILLVCSYFPFPHSGIPLDILSSRRTENSLTDVDVLGLCKAEETLRRIATEYNSCSWNWQWSPPFASSAMGPTRVANDTDEALSTFASKVTFMALEREACALSSKAVDDILAGLAHSRRLLECRLSGLGASKEYEKVEKKLKNPLARWIFSTSLRSIGDSPCASDAFASILHPIKELFENRELPLMSVLQRLKILGVLYQDILDGLDPRWDGLSEEDFCFLEDVNQTTPRELAGLLIDKDLSCSQKFYPKDFLHPAELRSRSPQWSSLVHTVRVCAKAHPDLVWRIDEAAKILLRHRNFFSGMALVYGLCEAKHPPVEWWWDVLAVRRVCMAYQARGSLLGLPQRIEVGAGSKPTGSKNKSGRSCTGDFLEITFTLCATLLGRKEVDSTAERSWSGGSIIASSEVGSKREHGRSGVENVGVVTSNLVLSELGSPVQQVNNSSHADDHDHTEIPIGADAHDNSDLDSAVGLGPRSRDSTTTLSSEDFQLIQRYGRGYSRCHEGKYLLPSDKEEQERLDLQHCLFSLTLDARLHLVQLPMTHRALDIGTGTGIWSRDFAYEHPDVEVYGLDLSPMLLKWAPPNCTFQIDDLSLPWTFEFPFDFIHGRMLFCSFSNPLHVFKEAFKALTARGVMEMQDLVFEFLSRDDSLEGSALDLWAKKLKEAFASKGIDLTSASRYRNYLETVGFEDIQQQEFIWPVGTWPTNQKSKYLGWLCQRNILDMLFAISIVPLTEYYSMSEEAVKLLLVRVREDLHNPEIHAYLQIVVVHGRKPKPDMFLALEG